MLEAGGEIQVIDLSLCRLWWWWHFGQWGPGEAGELSDRWNRWNKAYSGGDETAHQQCECSVRLNLAERGEPPIGWMVWLKPSARSPALAECKPSVMCSRLFSILQILEESDIDKDGTVNLSEFQHVISRSPDFVRWVERSLDNLSNVWWSQWPPL